jgi:hypothetical protein
MSGRKRKKEIRMIKAAQARRHATTIRRCGEKGNRNRSAVHTEVCLCPLQKRGQSALLLRRYPGLEK